MLLFKPLAVSRRALGNEDSKDKICLFPCLPVQGAPWETARVPVTALEPVAGEEMRVAGGRNESWAVAHGTCLPGRRLPHTGPNKHIRGAGVARHGDLYPAGCASCL